MKKTLINSSATTKPKVSILTKSHRPEGGDLQELEGGQHIDKKIVKSTGVSSKIASGLQKPLQNLTEVKYKGSITSKLDKIDLHN